MLINVYKKFELISDDDDDEQKSTTKCTIVWDSFWFPSIIVIILSLLSFTLLWITIYNEINMQWYSGVPSQDGDTQELYGKILLI